ncbi:hypothetical protein D9O50_02390 [Oxalobacteraceae bacterium CAVE-383]|nr:hypothetical protein D9O50_02390 [Oxalobacteraceae bacterium CAVE-383]
MALSGISQTTDTSAFSSHTPPAPTTVFTTEGLPGIAPPVIAKADAAAPADSEALSSIIANLGNNYAGAQTYNASGQLNSAALSGQAPTAQATPPTPAYEQDLTDMVVVSADAPVKASDGASGIYTPSGDLQDLPIYVANARTTGTIVNTQA